ncbi:MAG: hypothetical protein IPN11_03700 [Opitutaceae bacterium]|nr:hypothetical protein [Opitutaceae bacterium]
MVLVALCFVAVLAIAVTTYLTLSSRAMNLSARSYNAGLGMQVAETGVELAMSALNNGSWTGWTTSGSKATRTLNAASTPALPNYGMGITASVKILVTNRHVSNWRSGTSYSAGYAAWYRGQWYQCTSAAGPSMVPPSDATANWVSAPGAWNNSTPYAADDIVTYDNVVYRCLLAHTGKTPPEATYWAVSNAAAWSSSASYSANDTALYGGTLYKCITGHSSQTPPNTTYWAGAPVIHVEGVANLPGNNPEQKTQLRADFIPAPLFPNAVGAANATTSINIASSGTLESYNSNALQPVRWSGSTVYVAGDVVYYPTTGQYYRALVDHSNQAPVVSGSANTTYWTPARTSYRAWNSSSNYSVGDIIVYSGELYRCISSHSNRTPPDTGYWLQQMPYTTWNSAKSYAIDDLAVAPTGIIYRCISSHSNRPPLTNLGTYWAAATPWSSGTAYALNELVSTASGAYVRCVSAHTSDLTTNTTENASLWQADLVGYPRWTTGISYAVGSIVFYQPPDEGGRQSSGMLYRCRSGPTSNNPANPNNWEVGSVGPSTWNSSTGYRIGDIVFYPVTGLFYRCKTAHTNQAPASATVIGSNWEHTGRYYSPWSSATAYQPGDIVFNAANGIVYRCTAAHTNSAPPNASYWTQIGTDFANWSASAAYKVGDLVYKTSNETVYRCIAAHTNQAPPNATYWSTSLLGYSAVVAAPAVTSSSTAVIKGYVNATTTTFGSNAVVKGPDSAASPKVDPARVFSNPYVPQFVPPASYAALTGPGTDLPDSEGNGTRLYEGARTLGTPGATSPSVYNITATYVYGSSSSNAAGLYLDDSTDVLTIVGPVILNVSGILYLNSGRIIIAPTGSLEIYFNGQLYIGNSTANTGGGIINQTFNPAKMLIASASTYNSSSYHYFWAWQPYHGLVYLPNAYLHKWNSGYNGELYGALSAKTVYFNHPANLDYDTALRTVGSIGTYIEQPYQITSWRELSDPAERISL